VHGLSWSVCVQSLGGGASAGGPRRNKLELLSAVTVRKQKHSSERHTVQQQHAGSAARHHPHRAHHSLWGPAPLRRSSRSIRWQCIVCCLLKPAFSLVPSTSPVFVPLVQPDGPLPPPEAKPTYHDVVATVAQVSTHETAQHQPRQRVRQLTRSARPPMAAGYAAVPGVGFGSVRISIYVF
jgi:hypothetical protein